MKRLIANLALTLKKYFSEISFASCIGTIYLNFIGDLNSFRIVITCFAVKSRNVLPPLTSNKLFALSSPIDVPRPPLSFNTTVESRRDVFWTTLPVISSFNVGNDFAASMESSEILPDEPLKSSEKEWEKAAIADLYINL